MTFTLEDTGESPFLHHVAALRELDAAAKSGELCSSLASAAQERGVDGSALHRFMIYLPNIENPDHWLTDMQRYTVVYEAACVACDRIADVAELEQRERCGRAGVDPLLFDDSKVYGLRTDQLCLHTDGPAKPATAGRGVRPRKPKAEAEVAIREYLRRNRGAKLSEVAKAVGCSVGAVSQSLPWRALRHVRKAEGGSRKGGTVRLTDTLKQTVGIEDDPLQRLIDEQARDQEPSPLEDEPCQRRPVTFHPNKRS